ncbi:MAG: hypothetical protein MJ229_02840 [bacterium]|nr:hypothetical protein [bacterium]
MNQLLMKQIAILSAILGGILGVITLIPFIKTLSFMALILCVSTIVLVYMKKNDAIGIINTREGAVFGAISGFVSFIAFSIVFIPLVSIIGLIFKSYNTYGILYLLKASGFFVLVMLVIFIAILSALMNAFSGLVTAYVYEYLTGIKKEANENFEIEIDN